MDIALSSKNNLFVGRLHFETPIQCFFLANNDPDTFGSNCFSFWAIPFSAILFAERVLQLQLEVEQEDRQAFFFRDEVPHALDGDPMLRLTRVNNPLFHEAVNSVRDAVYGINRRHRNVTALTTFEQGPQYFNGGVPGDPFQ